jgi:4-amino-4-deoxy-L-arabinose transferase-like glycosyltransferase
MWSDRRGASARLVGIGQRIRFLLGAPRFPLGCFIAYIAVRIAVLFIGPREQLSDFGSYYQLGVGIAAGSGYAHDGVATAFWPVGWPGFLGILFSFTGPSVLAAQVANLILSALVFMLTLSMGAALFRDRAVGRAAVLILTFYPNQIGYVPFLSTEIFYEFLLSLSLLLFVRDRFFSALLAGLVFGVATLTKPQTLLMPGFVLIGVFLAAPSWRWFGRLAGLGCAAYLMMVLVVTPWTYRNYIAFNTFIPVSLNGGWTLLTGNNPEANGGYTADTELARGLNKYPAEEVTTDRLARARAIGWIKEHPVKFLQLLPRKLARLWIPDGESEWYYQDGFPGFQAWSSAFRAVRIFNQAYYFAIWLMALRAGWLLLANRAKACPWVTMGFGLCVYLSLISLVFSGQPRFHYALMPMVSIYAAWTLVRTVRVKEVSA